MQKQECELFLEYVLDITSQMLQCGAEARRAENTALRLVEAYGFELRCANAVSSEMSVCIKAPRRQPLQPVRACAHHRNGFGQAGAAQRHGPAHLSDKPSVAEIGAMVSGEQRIGYSPWLELAGYITMTFGFAIFFGGDLLDGLASALVSVVIFCTNRLLNHRIQANQNRLFYTFLASFLSGCLALLLVRLGLGHNADMIIIGDVMVFIPGLSLVNGIRELFYRDILTGMYRLVEAIILAVAIAAGFGVAILLLGGIQV